ncbi:MAG: NUDIX hydrolase [Parcubacteria group bacterium]|nr:NUDIX hydrolase [Parcubacteria group bacterium]
MEIQSILTNKSGQTLDVFYHEGNPLENLDGKKLQGVHAYCFFNGKLVMVYAEDKKSWTPPGGGIKPGETFEEAVIREVEEESNMKVLHQEFIGYQDIHEPDRIIRQTRSFCIVEPFGEFVSDPDGDITEIKLIDPKEYKQYFDWGVVGDRIMSRALEMHTAHYNKLKKHE